MARSTPASVNSGVTTTTGFGATTPGTMRRCSLAAGGIERAGIITAARTGATCLVGSGEGIGVRRTGTAIAADRGSLDGASSPSLG